MITQQVYESKIKALMAKWKKSHEKKCKCTKYKLY